MFFDPAILFAAPEATDDSDDATYREPVDSEPVDSEPVAEGLLLGDLSEESLFAPNTNHRNPFDDTS